MDNEELQIRVQEALKFLETLERIQNSGHTNDEFRNVQYIWKNVRADLKYMCEDRYDNNAVRQHSRGMDEINKFFNHPVLDELINLHSKTYYFYLCFGGDIDNYIVETGSCENIEDLRLITLRLTKVIDVPDWFIFIAFGQIVWSNVPLISKYRRELDKK